MKRTIEITAFNSFGDRETKDAIIEHWSTPKLDSGNIVWVDEKERIAKHFELVRSVKFYASLPDGTSVLVGITGHSIKELMKLIEEIEQIESEEFTD